MALNANDRSIARFTMLGHSLVHWYEMSIPIFLVVWLVEFDVSVTVVGVIVAIGYAPVGLGALPGGILADRYGTKRLILCCLAGMSLSFLALSLATSIVVVALCLLCWGITASVYHPAGLSLISTGVEERGTVFAWHGIAGNLGIALGPFVAATGLLFLEWQFVAICMAVPGLLAVGYGLRAAFDPTAAAETDGGGRGREDGAETDDTPSLSGLVSQTRTLFASAFALVFLIVALEGLYYRSALTYLPEILHGLPAMSGFDPPAELEGIEPGDYIYVGLLVAGMAGQYVGGKLTDRVPAVRGLIGCFVLFVALALAFIPVSSMGAVPIAVLCGVFGFVLFAIEPFYQDAVAVYTPAESRGLSYGYTYLGMFGLGAAGVSLGGFVRDAFPLSTFFVLLATFAVAGVLLSVRLLLADEAATTRPTGVAESADD
ncbi:MFS transporter [Halobacteria archaeon AArc-m2/3/4]|uniref:MFS transporter n=1 Tax=Natronoglomus mannanivorans TaxID=2979990 RepID=A0ABT2QJZ4_9EURY|nr:MFS transporter [Halobacteria archaeon AArc-m2/3/4]